MKRISAFALFLLLLITLTAGCGNSNSTNGGETHENGSAQSAGSEGDPLEMITPSTYPQQVQRDIPERAPQLEVLLTSGNSPVQRIQAMQLTTSWMFTDENGTGGGYEADSAHPMQIAPDEFKEVTLFLKNVTGKIKIQFSDNYPPQSVSVQRWNADNAIGNQDIVDILDSGESVEIVEDVILVSNDGHDYIYEVYASWPNGSSYYTFRVECSASTAPNSFDSSDSEPLGFVLYIRTEHYEYKNDDTLTDFSVDHLLISGHPDKEIEQSINHTLREMAWLDEISPTDEALYYNMWCDYELFAGRFLSSRYYLSYYDHSAPHPWKSLNCKTIDLKTGQEIELTDIMTVDERFRQKFLNSELDYSDDSESQIIGLDEGALEECDYDDFYWYIIQNKTFSLSEDSISLVVEVPHASGDYWVLEYPYESVSELLLPWFSALLPSSG